ncbi:hypothetical protein NJ7G_2632 [Natrinema sp. J7-2]|nr:hypothetical protein NJ7G_2632 [Natrinema sp. J7-2]
MSLRSDSSEACRVVLNTQRVFGPFKRFISRHTEYCSNGRLDRTPTYEYSDRRSSAGLSA